MSSENVEATLVARLLAGPLGPTPAVWPGVTPQQLPLQVLSWQDFEALCFRLVRLDRNVTQCHPYGIRGQAQSGIDLLARTPSGNVVYQCKQRQAFSTADVRDAVARFLAGIWAQRVCRFVLCVSVPAVERTVVEAIAAEADRLGAAGIDFQVWDATELSARLKQHHDLVRDFFGQAGVDAFLAGPSIDAWNLPSPRRLTGRDAISDILAMRADPTRTDIVAITGLGGIGKSSLALDLAWDLRARGQVEIGWWARADTPVLLRRDLVDLANVLGVVDPGDADDHVQLLVRHLSNSSRRFVLVLDNVPESHALDGLLPESTGGVVVATSRTAVGWYRVARVVAVPELEREHGIELLCRLSGLDDVQGAGDVFDLLGGVPLALENGGVLCERMGWAFQRYRDEVRAQPSWVFDDAIDERDRPIFPALATSIAQLNPLASRLLGVLAWLHPDGIRRDLVAGDVASQVLGVAPRDLDLAIGELISLSLVRPLPERGAMATHRIVQLSARHQLPSCFGVAVDLIVRAWPSDTQDPDAHKEADRTLPHLVRVVDAGLARGVVDSSVATASLKAIDFLRKTGGAKAAWELAQLAVTAFGDDPELSCERGQLHYLRGRLRNQSPGSVDEQRRWGLDQFRTAVELLNPDGPSASLVRARTYESLLRLLLGEEKRGIAVVNQALQEARALGPQGARALVDALGVSVDNHVRVGDYATAHACALEMTALLDQVVPPVHPVRSYAANQLAKASVRVNRWTDALEGYQRAVAELEAALGKRETETLAKRYANQAWALLEMNCPEEALKPAAQAVSISERLGTSFTASLSARREFSARARSLAVDADQDNAYREIEVMARRLDDATLAVRLRLIARYHDRRGRHDYALLLLREAALLLEKGAKPSVEYRFEIWRELGAAEGRAGNGDVAEALLRRALDGSTQAAGASHRSTALARRELARVLFSTDPSAARAMVRDSYDDLLECLGPDHPDTRDADALVARLGGL